MLRARSARSVQPAWPEVGDGARHDFCSIHGVGRGGVMGVRVDILDYSLRMAKSGWLKAMVVLISVGLVKAFYSYTYL